MTARRVLTPVEITARYPSFRGGRLETWGAKSTDGVWTYERIETIGTPWEVRHVPTDKVVETWFSSLPNARAATADGTALRMLPVPEWLPVVGWDGLYEVSATGQIRSLPRRGGNNRTYGGRILTPSPAGNGYLMVQLCRAGVQRSSYVHDLVLTAYAGPRPEGQQACHGPAGQTVNVWPDNLSWGTRVENAADRKRDGTDTAGERHGMAKLSDPDVLAIRAAVGKTGRALAAEFGVSPATVSEIRSGKHWTHLGEAS